MGILNHPVVFICLGIIAGLIIGFYLRKRFVEGHQSNIKVQSKQIIENAIVEAEQLKKEALLQSKEEAYLVKQALEKELKGERDELKDEMRQLNKKREALKNDWDSFDSKHAELLAGEKRLKPILRPYDTLGSTRYVDFDTIKNAYAIFNWHCGAAQCGQVHLF